MCKAPTFSTITYFVNNSIYWHPIFFINIWNAKLDTQEKSDINYKYNKVYFYQSKTSFFHNKNCSPEVLMQVIN